MEVDAVVRRLTRYAIGLCIVLWFLATYLTPDKIAGVLRLKPGPKRLVNFSQKAQDFVESPTSFRGPPHANSDATRSEEPAPPKPLKVRALSRKLLFGFADERLQEVLQDLTPAFRDATGVKVVYSYGTSATLQQKLLSGEFADVFLATSQEPVMALRKQGKTATVIPVATIVWKGQDGQAPRRTTLTAAALAGSQYPPLADALVGFLSSDVGQKICLAHGFESLPPSPESEK